MPDLADAASVTIEQQSDIALARHAARRPGPAPLWINGEPHCATCGGELPTVRAVSKRGRCVACQEQWEREQARYGGSL